MTRTRFHIVVALGAFVLAGMFLFADSAAGAWSSASVSPANGVSAGSIGPTTNAAARAPFGCAAASLTWTAAAGADAYRIERTLDAGGSWTTIADAAPLDTSYTDPTVPQTAFTATYRVAARSVPGSWTGVAATTSAVSCATARDLVASLGEGQSVVRWSSATDATGYEVQRRVGASGAWTTVQSSTVAATWTDATQQAAGTTVSYRVRALGAGGVTGEWTNVASVTWTAAAQETLVTRTVTSDWSAGYCANVTIRNTGSTPVAWRAELSLAAYPWAGTITSINNATQVSLVNGIWTIEGVSWNRTLAAGASTTISYCATRPTPPTTTVPATIRITGTFGSGYCAEGIITNTLAVPITWRARFTPSSAGFAGTGFYPAGSPVMSNGSTVSFSASEWIVAGASWNATADPGETRTFSWCGVKSGS